MPRTSQSRIQPARARTKGKARLDYVCMCVLCCKMVIYQWIHLETLLFHQSVSLTISFSLGVKAAENRKPMEIPQVFEACQPKAVTTQRSCTKQTNVQTIQASKLIFKGHRNAIRTTAICQVAAREPNCFVAVYYLRAAMSHDHLVPDDSQLSHILPTPGQPCS